MSKRRSIVVIGGGGHAKVVIDAIKASSHFSIAGVVDKKLKRGFLVSGVRVVGDDGLLVSLLRKGVKCAAIGVGSIGNCDRRKRIYDRVKKTGFDLPVISHPDAVMSKEVVIGEGTFIAARVTVNPGTYIGKCAIINTSSSVDHDCQIGDFVHIAPGVTLSGGVKIGHETHIGTGASVIHAINIGSGAMVASGAAVRRNVPNNALEFGGPRRGRMNRKVFIIAEAGVNHNGDIEIAKVMIDKAAAVGADAIKFQSFKADRLAIPETPKAGYQKNMTDRKESQRDMLKKLELGSEEHYMLMDRCRKKGLMFLSSPFDTESIDFLANAGLGIFKIPSGQIVDLPYLRKIGKLKKRVIMSTGMATLDDIKGALDILVDSGMRRKDITLLHSTTEYPTFYEEANLLAMLAIRDVFMVDVGYSDHTVGIESALAAVALGASVIEKHFTLDKVMEGPDHAASADPNELKRLVISIRNIEKALGSGVKKPYASEFKNAFAVRKSIVASRSIKKGEPFTESNLTTKRPATGITPMLWDSVVGSIAKKDFQKDELIEI